MFFPGKLIPFMQAVLLFLLATCFPLLATGAQRPNILLILVDDMGYGDLKCYNPDSRIPTPHLDRFATTAMRFTDAHAPGPLCHMSRYGLMTGRFPFRVDVSAWPRQPLIREGEVTIASLLKSQGYRTAMVGKWHLGFQENGYENPLPGGPVDHGFDHFFGIRASTDIPPYFYIRDNRALQPPTNHIASNNTEGWSPIQGAFWRAGGIAPDLNLDDVLPRFTNEAIKVITDHAGTPPPASSPNNKSPITNPLFLYLAYPAPHTPWLPSGKFKGVGGAGLYGEFAAMVDAEIGRVLDALAFAGMAQDTLVIISSDNGPVWYEEDVKRFEHDSAGGLRGMKADAWEAGHRMPFLVRWPGHVKAGTVSDHLLCFTDLLATFADLTGAELPPGAGPDSRDFLPVLTGGSDAEERPRDPIVMKSGGGAMMIRDGEWKLIDRLGSGGFSTPKRVQPGPDDPKGQLYHLTEDPAEERNLWKEHPEIVARLTARMAEISGKE